MYVPTHFAEARLEAVRTLVEAHPLATLVTQGPEGLTANHLPFLVDWGEDGPVALRGHVAKGNSLVEQVAAGSDVLVVYRSEDSYVSPNWYPSKAETHRHVPTWNYQAVHLHGRLEFSSDPAFLRRVLGELTQIHERHLGGPRPWKMGDAPADFLALRMAGIVGVRIQVTRWVAKSKLSQNRDRRDFEGVADAMERQGRPYLRAAMEGVRPLHAADSIDPAATREAGKPAPDDGPSDGDLDAAAGRVRRQPR